MTKLQLHCHTAQIDFNSIGALKQFCSLTLSYSPSEKLYSGVLQPLTACKYLTALEVDSFVLIAWQHQYPGSALEPETDSSKVASAISTTVQVAVHHTQHRLQRKQQVMRRLQQQQLLQQQHSRQHGQQLSWQPLQAGQLRSVDSPASWQLNGLRKLSLGNIGVAYLYAPVSAPNLTELRDVSPDKSQGRTSVA